MIIDKGISIGEVVTLRLTTGEEIICKLVEDTATNVLISKPMVLSMGQQGLGMMPFIFTVHPDKNIKLAKASVVMMEATDKQFADQYIQSTTGIKLA
jgi:hypothetical protein